MAIDSFLKYTPPRVLIDHKRAHFSIYIINLLQVSELDKNYGNKNGWMLLLTVVYQYIISLYIHCIC